MNKEVVLKALDAWIKLGEELISGVRLLLEQEQDYCEKCEPAPGKMIPVISLAEGNIRCQNCNKILG